ncbi:hypothetical protein [Paenarthrobacter nicotinovorans]|uniref:hypothetical protein n=1 Tax=Paenarthrobacter nicotinovorans TaxID=29320 RepID=UPI00119F9FF1|nr:hypothetical protein [Paenarthrobacter nicotinovorans]
MDPIKNQISAIDPWDMNDAPEPKGEEALHKILSGTTVFSDADIPSNVTSLDKRRARKFQVAGGLLLGAAAVTAGVLVAANFGPVSATPAPAATFTSAEATATPSVSASPSPTATPTPTPTATPTAAATAPQPASTPIATAPVVAPTPVSTTTLPHAAQVQSYTFPDGHLSFSYPVGWSVKTEQGPYLSEETKSGSQGATVMDSAGTPVAYVYSGFYGDGTAGLVDRTVLDRAVVSGVRDVSGSQVEFGFSSIQPQYIPYEGPPYEGMPSPQSGPVEGPPTYIMDVRLTSELKAGISSSGTNQITMPNGVMSAYVLFDPAKQPTFASPGGARAWMGTAQYQQLKSLLLSLRYQ